MKLPGRRVLVATSIITVFVSGAAAIYVFLLSSTGLRIPWVQPEPYTVAVELADADNLVQLSTVRIAGVDVGKIQEVSPQGPTQPARAVISLDDDAVPLHQGAKVRVGEKSLLGDSYLEVRDGHGPAIKSGSTLSRRAVKQSTQVRDLLASLDPPTRQAIGGTIHSLDGGTRGTRQDFSATLSGLGDLGRQGHTAIDAIAAQSEDLRSLARETTTVLQALDTGEGQIADMVGNAQRVTASTAGQRQAIESTMRQLPGTLGKAKTATGTLTDLSGALAPIASNVKQAAPLLDSALRELPSTTRDVRGLLPSLDGTLRRAPATLDRVPMFSQDVRDVAPSAQSVLRDVNPMLAYLKPYGRDLASLVSNFSASLGYTDEAGNTYLRLQPRVSELSVQSPLRFGALTYKNPYPTGGTGGAQGPFTGKYPRVEREPR